MRITLDETLTFEFDHWSIETAGRAIDEIKMRHKERGDSVLRAVSTLLILGQIEQQCPGTLQSLLGEGQSIAKTLDGLKPKRDSQ